MFFKNKETKQTQKNRHVYELTDEFCRNLDANDYEGSKTITDKLCRNLRVAVSSRGNHSYIYLSSKGNKVIGNVYQITIKDARRIAHNINEYKDEFIRELPNIKLPLFAYFQKFGEFPHKPKGTEVIISDENFSLKEKIKELQTENAVLLSQVTELKEINTQLVSRINSIRKLVNYDEYDTQIDD